MPEINLTLPQTDLLSLAPALPALSNVSSETSTDFADIFNEIVAGPAPAPAQVETIRPQAENPIEAELLFWLSRSTGPALELETPQPELPTSHVEGKAKFKKDAPQPQHPLLNQEGAGGGFNFLADSLLNLVTTPRPAAAAPPETGGANALNLSLASTPDQSQGSQAIHPAMQKNGRESINLADFDVKRFEFKTELDTSMAPAFKPIRIVPELVIPPQAILKAEKPQDKPTSEPMLFNTSGSDTAAERAPEVSSPEPIQPVRVVIEPPPPPPVARQVSMDIGDAESQVRVVIRERNGELDLRFEAGNEDLRRELESSSPGLLNELQRDGARGVTLDFTSFGSATDADKQQQQQNRSKKQLKSDAVFADLNETAYSLEEPSSLKSL